jgi:hypothetical protein
MAPALLLLSLLEVAIGRTLDPELEALLRSHALHHQRGMMMLHLVVADARAFDS